MCFISVGLRWSPSPLSSNQDLRESLFLGKGNTCPDWRLWFQMGARAKKLEMLGFCFFFTRRYFGKLSTCAPSAGTHLGEAGERTVLPVEQAATLRVRKLRQDRGRRRRTAAPRHVRVSVRVSRVLREVRAWERAQQTRRQCHRITPDIFGFADSDSRFV